MARMHAALSETNLYRQNSLSIASWPRLFQGRETIAASLAPNLDNLIAGDLERLQDQWPVPEDLPQGIIHADLFPDNAFFLGNDFSGVIDFYYACHECLLFDLAGICSDWAWRDGEFLTAHWQAFLAAYTRRRPLTEAEIAAWPAMLRAVALRFWVSRLIDACFPMGGPDVQIHDPAPFKHLLLAYRDDPPGRAGRPQGRGAHRDLPAVRPALRDARDRKTHH